MCSTIDELSRQPEVTPVLATHVRDATRGVRLRTDGATRNREDGFRARNGLKTAQGVRGTLIARFDAVEFSQ